MTLDNKKLPGHFEKLAAGLGLDPVECAEGVLAVANTTMERAIKVISVERGYDPREFTLFSFGGAGGMHAAFLAKGLNISQVFIPGKPGVLSAFGMLMSDVIKDYSQTVMLRGLQASTDVLDRYFKPLEERGYGDLLAEGVPSGNVLLQRYLDMRYQGQSYELLLPYQPSFPDSFHELHEKTYGYCNRDKAVEVVNVRVRAIGQPDKPELQESAMDSEQPVEEAMKGVRSAVFDGETRETKIFDRENLKPGNRIDGPAIIVEYSSTIVVPPFACARIDAFSNIIMTIKPEGGAI